MIDFLLYPSTLIWNRDDYINNPHCYDGIISSIIEILHLQESSDYELTLIEDFIYQLLDYFPFQDISKSHHVQRVDFVTHVTSAVAKWMSDGNTADSRDDSALNDHVSIAPRLFKIDNDPNIDKIERRSNSWLFNKPDCVAIALNNSGIKNVDLQKSIPNLPSEEIGNVFIIDDLDGFRKYIDNEKLICHFSKKHHPITGWGSKMPHEDLDIMQSLLEKSIYEEGHEHRVRYAKCNRDDIYYVFRITNGKVFHPYPVKLDELPNDIANQLNALI